MRDGMIIAKHDALVTVVKGLAENMDQMYMRLLARESALEKVLLRGGFHAVLLALKLIFCPKRVKAEIFRAESHFKGELFATRAEAMETARAARATVPPPPPAKKLILPGSNGAPLAIYPPC